MSGLSFRRGPQWFHPQRRLNSLGLGKPGFSQAADAYLAFEIFPLKKQILSRKYILGGRRPGAGRPPGAENKDKPFRDALRMEALALTDGKVIKHQPGSLRWNAQRLLMMGEVSSIREVADRLDGKVAQTITGKDESPLIPEVSDERLGLALAVFLAKKSKGAE